MNSKYKKEKWPPYIQNRELSWLKFNERVLEEASSPATPLFGRLRFISIFTSNLDEFFMVRVGALTDYMLYDPECEDSKTGLDAKQQLELIYDATKPLYVIRDHMYDILSRQLDKSGVKRRSIAGLSDIEFHDLHFLFKKDILPLLSPQIVDSTHPFPHLTNKQLHIAVRLESKHKKLYGLIPVPAGADRVIPIGNDGFILLEDVILKFAHSVFGKYNTVEENIIAVTRNADIDFDDGYIDETEDFRKHIQQALKKRSRLAPVRLELQSPASKEFKDFFEEKLAMAFTQTFTSTAPLDFSFCGTVERMFSNEQYSSLKAPAHHPLESVPERVMQNMLSLVSRRDMLLSYPFESISPFLALIRQAARDPSVVSIKITLYRIGQHSKLAQSLIQAAENGKEVIIIMELRARFDEDNNIQWAEQLEESGCKVLYGLPDYKVHCKVCLITRRQGGNVKYITQIGTGNYNEETAKQYTDLALITSDQEIGEDAVNMFNNLLIGELEGTYSRLLVAPASLKQGIIRCIDREIDKAKRGYNASIILKCNSVTDKEIIDKLVEASKSGANVRMIVRGISCLVAGVPEYTENITITSIVGQFLEHSRIFCFGEGDNRVVYISSADLMTRNTTDRVEVACPVLDKTLSNRIAQMLDVMLSDNVKAWEQIPDGNYIRKIITNDTHINSQEYFTEHIQLHHTLESSGKALVPIQNNKKVNVKKVSTIGKVIRILMSKPKSRNK